MARKTCHTMTREPLNVGLPWQMPLSATMYFPSSTRLRGGLLASLVFITQILAETRSVCKSRFELLREMTE